MPKHRNLPKINTGKLFRTFQVRKESINEEDRTVELSFSSETPVPRWWGNEILDHGPKSVRLKRLQAGGPFLMDHWSGDHRGVIESVKIEDKRGIATVRLSKSARGEELFQDMKDGIRTSISVGYLIHKMRLEEEKDGFKTYRATDWEPIEISSVAMPADLSVGVGRSEDQEFPHETQLEPEEEERTMEKCPHCQRDLVGGVCTCEGYRAANPPAGTAAATRSAAPATVNEGDILARERKRVGDIEALARRFPQLTGVADLARQFRDNGSSPGDFQTALLARLGQPAATDVPEPVGDLLNERENKSYSVRNAILLALGERSDGIEADVHQHIEKKLGRSSAGVFIPLSLRGQRAVVGTAASTLSAAAGGAVIDTSLMPLIEILRNKMMCRALGARVLSGLVGNLSFPKQIASAVLAWMAENSGTDVSESDLSAFLGSIAMGPKSAMATTAVTRQMLAQGSEDIEMLIRDDLAAVNALGLDYAAIAGTGSNNQPRGILNTSGIGSVAGGDNGLAPAWSHIVNLETEVSVDNADIGTLAYLTNPKVRGKLKQTEKASGTAQFIWEKGAAGFGEMNGYRAAATNQVPSNLTKGSANAICSAVIFGNFNDLMIGEWGVLEIIADPYTLKKQGLIELTSFMMADVAVRRAESFAAMKDALTA